MSAIENEVSEVEIKGRKLEVLAAVVEIYIQTSQPVGSSKVCEYLSFRVSPATVRGDMVQLSLMGFLIQPHISAGRVPSQLGYRIYIDCSMKQYVLSVYDKSVIDAELKTKLLSPESIVNNATKILTEITDCAAISASPWSENVYVRNIKFIKVNTNNAIVVIITTTGLVKARLFNCKFEITEKIIEIFMKVAQNFLNKPLSFLSPEYIGMIFNRDGAENFFILPALEALMSVAHQLEISEINIEGELNLLDKTLNKFEDVVGVLKFLNKKEEILKFLFSKKNGTGVFIGKETGISFLSKISVIKTYYIVGESFGVMALFGPLNINYPCVIAKLNYVSKSVEKILKKFLMR